jgi:NAD(P)H-dependent FMN reductase
MPMTPKILAFAGSTRDGSFNKKLIKVAEDAARSTGAEVTHLDLRDLNLPLFDGDLEAKITLPEGGKRIKDLMRASHAFLISAPEYNSSISGVLKNAIDWASRPEPGQPPLSCFTDKVAGLMSASPGALGGLRGLVTLRSILENIGTVCLPKQLSVSKANEAFTDDGKLKDPKQQASVEAIAKGVVEMVKKLRA